MTTRDRTTMRVNETRRGEQLGMALLIVLWAISILALISAVFTTTTRTEINRTRNLVENAKAEGLADAGIYRAITALLEADPSRRPLLDGTAYRWRFDGVEIVVSIQSEAGKIDLNTASDQLLKGLFVSVGVETDRARALVDSIRDFADQDDLRRALGTEDADYRGAGLPDGAKDGKFDSVAELQQVLGITTELYENVAPVLTVYSGGRSIDPSTAPVAALLALPGATKAQVEASVASRRNLSSARADSAPNGSEQRQDFFQTFNDVASDDQTSSRHVVRQRRHPVVTVTARAETPGGGVFERLAVVRLTNDPARPFILHEWRQVWETELEGDDVTDTIPEEGDAAE